ncbi:S41 family peptidase [Brevibacillus humidisoli]|uniref:S41 family peptidase n=1 Tax=Brevibacillus humidisoli TaxID=2895522 RepID=UPI001E3D5E4D|nr:S41 family peptidase [Brevibacillus humidisoli]UFJ43121.1 S41 family peptidase [Brevibacillus humidisoli]
MRKLFNRLAAALLFSVLLAAPGHAQTVPSQPPQSLLEIADAYRYLLENHISRPETVQLVQGALTNISEQAKEKKGLDLSVDTRDDTFEELQQQLEEWRKQHSLTWKQLHQWAITGMVDTLGDPHTMFFTADELRQFRDDLENETVGFGFRFQVEDQYLLIKQVIPDSPAEAAGIEAGDYLLAVDGAKTAGSNLEEAINHLRGEEGSLAVLTVYRPKEKRSLELTVARAYLIMPEVWGARFAGDIGYINIATFGSDAGYQFRDELARISAAASLKGLIIDLRDNGGGFLSSARDVASLLMEEGLLMHTVNRNGVEIETWVRNGRPISYPVRILVNQGTASASELLAGALRDHQIAKLVGTVTFGKGSAQQIIPLNDGDALKITLEEYYTPNRTVINHVGLQPDITVEDDVAQVLKGMLSLGVKRLELLETEGGQFTVNDVSLPLYRPVFKSSVDSSGERIVMRSAVLASLTGDTSLAEADYVPVQSRLYPTGTIEVTREEKQIKLIFVAKE